MCMIPEDKTGFPLLLCQVQAGCIGFIENGWEPVGSAAAVEQTVDTADKTADFEVLQIPH